MTNQQFEAFNGKGADSSGAAMQFAEERHKDMMCTAWQPTRTSTPDMVDALRSTPDGGTQTLFQILNQHQGQEANNTLTRSELGDYLLNYEQNCLDGKPGFDPANRKVVSDLYRHWDHYSERLGVEEGKGCFGGLAESLDRASITVKELDDFDDRPMHRHPMPSWPREDNPRLPWPREDRPKPPWSGGDNPRLPWPREDRPKTPWFGEDRPRIEILPNYTAPPVVLEPLDYTLKGRTE